MLVLDSIASETAFYQRNQGVTFVKIASGSVFFISGEGYLNQKGIHQ